MVGIRADAVLPLAEGDIGPRDDVGWAGEAESGLENGRIRHLLHEQGNVLEDVAVVHAEAAAHHLLTASGEVVGKAHARAEVEIVVMRDAGHVGIGNGAVERDQFLVGAAVLDVGAADHVEVLVPAQAKVQQQARRDLAVVLDIEAELLGCHQEVGIAVGLGHTGNQARSREPLRVGRRDR